MVLFIREPIKESNLMGFVLPKYIKPYKSIDDPIVKVEEWDSAVDAFEQKRYKESLMDLFNYINDSLLKGVKTKKDFKFSKMQGSAEVNVEVSNGKLTVESPFVRITDDTNVVALLRRVTEINFSTLDLEQIILKNDTLIFRYEALLSTCQPNKIYNVINNIALRADDFDDIFIEEYGAKRYKELNVKSLTQEQKSETIKYIREILKEVDEFSEEFVQERKENYRWDIVVITLLRLSNMPYMQGRLRSDLIDNIERMYDGDIELNQRINKGLLYIKELQDYSDEYYEKNLYHAEQLISLRWRFTPQILQERMEGHKKTLTNMIEHDDHLAQSYFLSGVFLKLIYNYNLNKQYKGEIERVLTEVSGKSTKDAAPKLVELYWDIYYATLEDKVKKRKRNKIMLWLLVAFFAISFIGDFIKKHIL